MSSHEASVAILMPVVEQKYYPRFTERYQGLADELSAHAVQAYFSEGHASYDAEADAFRNVFDIQRRQLADAASPHVVRDLTMALDAKPLYQNAALHRLVHDPDTNRFIANKANLYVAAPAIHPQTIVGQAAEILDRASEIPGQRVVVKPVTGMLSQGVHVVSKTDLAQLSPETGDYLLQEFINTSNGIPELGVSGVHNLRIISIGSVAIGAISREGGTSPDMLKADVYGSFVGPDELPDTMHAIVDTVHDVLRSQPGDGQNVIAIDIMRGIDGDGELKDVLCEVNRRPLRISNWELHDTDNLDRSAISTIASKWDRAEAAMLTRLVEEI